MASQVQINDAALRELLEDREGPVGQRLLADAETVRAYAAAHCPVETPQSAEEHKREPGRLRDSIGIRWAEGTLAVQVGSDLAFARRIEFNPAVGGWLRGGLAAAVGADAIRRPT